MGKAQTSDGCGDLGRRAIMLWWLGLLLVPALALISPHLLRWAAPAMVTWLVALLRKDVLALWSAVCVLVACLAMALVYYTFGEVMQGILVLFLLPILVGAIACWIASPEVWRRFLLWTSLAVAVLLGPFQFSLGLKWAAVHAEALRITAYADGEHARTGTYPASLESYPWRMAWLESSVSYRRNENGDDFDVYYRIWSWNVGHHIYSKTGWFYYPD